MSPSDALRAEFISRAERFGTRIVSCTAAELGPTLEAHALPECAVASDLVDVAPELARFSSGVDGWPIVTLSLAQFGIAATGSVVSAPRAHRDRLLSLLCRRHILVMPAGAIVPTLMDASTILKQWVVRDDLAPRSGRAAETGPERRYVTFISGPSRTSDIERVLTIGVHGPEEQIAVLVEDWLTDGT